MCCPRTPFSLVLALQLTGGAPAVECTLLGSPSSQSTDLQKQGTSAQFGVVHFLVLDTYGRSLHTFEIQLIDNSGAKQMLRQQGDVQLPFGTYRVRGSVSMHHSMEKQIVVDSPRSLEVLAFSFLDPGLSTVLHSSVRGKIVDSPPGTTPLWIRAVSLRGEFNKVVKAETDGSFLIDSVPYGDYLLIAFKGGALIKIQQFSFTVMEEEAIITAASTTRTQ